MELRLLHPLPILRRHYMQLSRLDDNVPGYVFYQARVLGNSFSSMTHPNTLTLSGP